MPQELWLLPMQTLMDFSSWQSYEELQQKGRLVRKRGRKVVLISHEWAATQPDPKMQQMSVPWQQEMRMPGAAYWAVNGIQAIERDRCMAV